MAKKKANKRTDDTALKVREHAGFAIHDRTGKYAVDHDKRRMWFRAAGKEIVEQDGKAIRPTAWRKYLKGFRKYGPFVDSHEYTPVTERLLGTVVDAEIDADGLLTQVEFAGDPVHPKGAAAWYLYSNKYARAVSVAWDKELRREVTAEDGTRHWDVYEARPRELTACIMPADMTALSIQSDPMAEVAYRTLNIHADGDENEGDDDDEALLIHEDPDRIAEIVASLARIEEQLDHLTKRMETIEAVKRPVIDSAPEKFQWIRDMAKVSGIEDADLRRALLDNKTDKE